MFEWTIIAPCLLLVALLIEARSQKARRVRFMSHAPCGVEGCRCCTKLFRIWFSRLC